MIKIEEIKILKNDVYNKLISEVYYRKFEIFTSKLMSDIEVNKNIKCLLKLKLISNQIKKLETSDNNDSIIKMFITSKGTINLILKSADFLIILEYFKLLIYKDKETIYDENLLDNFERKYISNFYTYYCKFNNYSKFKILSKKLEKRINDIYKILKEQNAIITVKELEVLQRNYHNLFNIAISNLKTKQKLHLNHQEV